MSGTPPSSSDRPETVAPDRHRLSRNRRRPSRYDLLLAVVPLSFVAGLLAVGLADVPFRVAMSSAAAVGALALVDGLFLNPPRRPRARDGPG